MKRFTLLAGFLLAVAFARLSTAAAGEPAIGDLPARTADPAARKWEITNYLKGTPAEIKRILDKELVEFDAKCKSAEADLRDAERRYHEVELLVLADVRKRPDYAAAAAEVVQAQAQVDASKNAPLSERMGATSRLNKCKAEAQRIERAAVTAHPKLAEMRKQQLPLKDRVAKLQAARAKALDSRNSVTDAILNTYELRGPVKAGRSFGVIRQVTVIHVQDDGAVLVDYELRQEIGRKDGGEGFDHVDFDVKSVPIVLRSPPPELKAAKPDQTVVLNATWRVTKVAKTQYLESAEALFVEPFETDVDYLLKTVLPLPIELPPPPAKGKTQQK